MKANKFVKNEWAKIRLRAMQSPTCLMKVFFRFNEAGVFELIDPKRVFVAISEFFVHHISSCRI